MAGGAGGAVTQTNAVSGSTNGGALTLAQYAQGGQGGNAAGAASGAGGAAASSLTFNDASNPTQSSAVKITVGSQGGAGGAALGVLNGASGGKATSALTATATTAATLSASANAAGGDGGSAGSGATGAGGAATATTIATGASVIARSSATGGTGGAAGAAVATATATGQSGTFGASANTDLAPGKLVQSVSSSASGSVDGTSTGYAKAAIGAASPVFSTTGQALAYETGAPTAASTKAVLTANPDISSTFGSKPVFFAVGELGGGYSVGGVSISQTSTAEIDETVDLTKLAARKNLVIGFYNGATVGSGVSGVTFDLYADGSDILSKTFASAAAAQTWFTNNAVDLGSLAADPQLDANTLTLKAVLTVTSTSPGSGFYGDVIIGDPPPAPNATTNIRAFVGAMAEFGSDAGAGASAPFVSASAHQPAPLLASPAFA